MKIDKEKLDALLAMPDRELWETVKSMARGYGFKLPDNPPPKEDMDKMRNAVKDTSNPNVSEALKLINKYRKECKNG